MREREVQWEIAVTSSDSRPSSLAAPGDPSMQGERDTSTNPIVLVSRVCTGRTGATKPRHWMRNDDPFPLPLLMTFPVSFERREKSASRAPQSIGRAPCACERGADVSRAAS